MGRTEIDTDRNDGDRSTSKRIDFPSDLDLAIRAWFERAWFDQWQERDYEECLDWSLNAEQCALELHWIEEE